MEGPPLPGASSACEHRGFPMRMELLGCILVPLASSVRALGLPLSWDRVSDGVKVSVVPARDGPCLPCRP